MKCFYNVALRCRLAIAKKLAIPLIVNVSYLTLVKIKFVNRFRFILAVIVMFMLNAYNMVIACPGCKDAYDAGSGHSSIGESYSWSVVFFLAMFTGLILFGFFFVRWQFQKHASFKEVHH